jgi:hypothetical protein
MKIKTDVGSYVIVRTQNAGVFAGTMGLEKDNKVLLTDARRIWFWAGAASLSELATKGTSKPSECKFPAAVEEVKLFEVIEILAVTDVARASIEGVPTWTKH